MIPPLIYDLCKTRYQSKAVLFKQEGHDGPGSIYCMPLPGLYLTLSLALTLRAWVRVKRLSLTTPNWKYLPGHFSKDAQI